METFKFILFGLAGLSVIFWVSVIALWHTYMIPTLFEDDPQLDPITSKQYSAAILSKSGLIDRGKYSNKSFVIADFSPVESTYGVNRLYTSMLISLGVMSFTLFIYGLQSALSLYGLT